MMIKIYAAKKYKEKEKTEKKREDGCRSDVDADAIQKTVKTKQELTLTKMNERVCENNQ